MDFPTVCCMCGDVGFPEKLFNCSKCRHRFQHSYCSNYYNEISETVEICDWCQCEERNSLSGNKSFSTKNQKKSISDRPEKISSTAVEAPPEKATHSGHRLVGTSFLRI